MIIVWHGGGVLVMEEVAAHSSDYALPSLRGGWRVSARALVGRVAGIAPIPVARHVRDQQPREKREEVYGVQCLVEILTRYGN